MNVKDELFFAWLDGALPPDEAARVAEEVAADPELASLAAQHRAMQARLRSAFDSVAEAPVPERLRAALEAQPAVVDLYAARRALRHSRWRAPRQWAAIAASLAVGIFIGTAVERPGASPVEVSGGKFYASAALDRSLERELASSPEGDIRIGLTFRDRNGAVCRTFSEPGASGLACRDQDRWELRGLFGAPRAPAGEYRMAAGMDPNLAALVDSTMAGEPFDATEERSAKQRGWH